MKNVAKIQDYRFGRVVVEGQPETRDLIVVPGRVVLNWWRRAGHALVLEDLEVVLDKLPERLIVGMGASSRMRPDPATLERLSERGIEVECLPTDRAVIRFGELDPARTAAALHLTAEHGAGPVALMTRAKTGSWLPSPTSPQRP